jgi:hypothetical protein
MAASEPAIERINTTIDDRNGHACPGKLPTLKPHSTPMLLVSRK